jgi:hypothetical protein
MQLCLLKSVPKKSPNFLLQKIRTIEFLKEK